jgi:TolB protein
MKPNFKSIIFIVALLILNILFMKAQPSFGIFDNASDIGNVKIKGSCFYDSLIEKYTVKGSGKNMWYNSDEFFFVWKKMKGDFILTTYLNWIGKGVEPHRKAGLIFRESLEPGSPYIDIANHGEGLISTQYRLEKDSVTKEIQCLAKSTPVLQIEKSGDTIFTRVAHSQEPFEKAGELKMHFISDEYYVGLFICAHNVDVIEEANFLNTRLEIPAKKNFIPYKDYIGSRLEILDIETGLRKIIYQSSTPFEAPNWTKDGKLLILNSKGFIYKIPVEGGKPELINTDFANSNNNDHGLSPDGKQFVISHHAKDRLPGENSVIYTLPVTGGVPKQITMNSPSYWHGWSPDGVYLIYTAKRNNLWNIFRIPAIGGKEVQLTDNKFLNDGSEYSTDGKFIWFNSNRSGAMQIWRMKSDGSEQTQITFDNYQNWFAHQSPDGKKIIFLSYLPEVNSGDHPYYKHVLLRIMDINELKPKVIAYLYGGQGTINVPSWSPDSKKVAFVSNSDGIK